ncbi:hypothetical protein GCM10011348_41220 [Marinobacterium nitratireducens]|uniref:Uncharacterized protein n=2 Tax=Marinobacterium nitratireducens TaxID=518897 RepID=A0A917ZQB2_9GAMM|nr:hypothetical protein GCM10011348_41220 [Marinobacterium nitratireducens]
MASEQQFREAAAADVCADAVTDGGFDRGFGRMLQHAGIPDALIQELSQDASEPGITALEQVLLGCWPVDDYQAAVSEPEAVVARTEQARSTFMDGAAQLNRELETLDIAGLIDIRVTVGGVQLDWSRFECCDLHFGQLWLAETRMLEWLADARERVEGLCRPARTWALAASVCEIERETGQTRATAVESGDLQAYTGLVFKWAWNLQGLNALEYGELAARGQNPLLLAIGGSRLRAGYGVPSQAFRTLGLSTRNATAEQLRAVARLLFDRGDLAPEQFSLLSHCDSLLRPSERLAAHDWVDRYGQLLADLWIRGDRGSWVESTLDLLKRAESGVAA